MLQLPIVQSVLAGRRGQRSWAICLEHAEGILGFDSIYRWFCRPIFWESHKACVSYHFQNGYCMDIFGYWCWMGRFVGILYLPFIPATEIPLTGPSAGNAAAAAPPTRQRALPSGPTGVSGFATAATMQKRTKDGEIFRFTMIHQRKSHGSWG